MCKLGTVFMASGFGLIVGGPAMLTSGYALAIFFDFFTGFAVAEATVRTLSFIYPIVGITGAVLLGTGTFLELRRVG